MVKKLVKVTEADFADFDLTPEIKRKLEATRLVSQRQIRLEL
jgi:hypothetical protein